MNKKLLIGIIAVVVIALGAVFMITGSKDSDMDMQPMDMSQQDDNSSSEIAPTNTVIIDNLDFQQKEITVKKGDTVTWKNNDSAKHNVIFDDSSVGEVENSKLIGQGEELKFTFEKTGEFDYSCSPHPFMKAKVIVTQ